jgi:hypothetical protein
MLQCQMASNSAPCAAANQWPFRKTTREWVCTHEEVAAASTISLLDPSEWNEDTACHRDGSFRSHADPVGKQERRLF